MIEIAVAVITGLFALLVGLLESRRRKDNRETKATLEEVRYHTSNDHATNLRDDMDEIKDDVRELVYLVKEVVVPEVRDLRERIGRTDERLDNHISN